jgi:glycine hydroxymethyltransferase
MDKEVKRIYDAEINRQSQTIELIASENFASQAVKKLCGSEFTNKYAEGYPGKRYYNGCEYMDQIEQLAIDELKKLYNCEYANVQPHCGANANTAVYQAFLKPGDTILGMDLASGGHLSHGSKPNISGKIYDAHYYGVDKDGWLDYNAIKEQAKKLKPKMIVAGASAYSRQIHWYIFREIADEVGAYLLCDMAHYSGLIAGGSYDNPVPHADAVTSTTHKTLRGPRGGIILWDNDEHTKKINSAIFPGTQGGPLMNMIASKAQAFKEANTTEFRQYIQNVINNAKAMAEVFIENDFNVLTGGTDSHMMLIDLSDKKYSGRESADKLEEMGITVNKNGIPNDPRSFVETSGIRIGTAAETTRGRPASWFRDVAKRIINIITL